MRRLLLLSLLLPVGLLAQPSSGIARHVTWGTVLPSTCSPLTGDVFMLVNTGSVTASFYQCSAANTWSTFTAGTGLTSLNGLTSNTQTFSVTSTPCTAVTLTSSGSVHTLCVPMASATGVTGGLITKTFYDTIITSATTLGGGLSGNLPNPTVAQINGAAMPSSAAVVASNASRQLIAATTSGTGSTVVLSSGATLTGATVDGVNSTTFGYLDPTSSVQTQLNSKANSASPTITGHMTLEGQTLTGVTGTGNLVLSAGPTFTGTVAAATLTASTAVNFSSATTRTIQTGTTAALPATCTVGQTYFENDAAPGSNLLGCVATNTWSLLGGGAGNVVGPNSATAGDIPGFTDTTGRLLSDTYSVVTTLPTPGTNAQIATAAAVRAAISAAGGGNVNAGGTLTLNAPVIGAGTTNVSVGSVSGNTTTFVTTTGAQTAGAPTVIDANGNHVAATSAIGATYGGTSNAFFQVSGPATSIKTYTFPNANSTMAALGTAQSWTANQTFTGANFLLGGSTSGTTTVQASAVASGTVTVPAATDTLVGRVTTDTLQNKTIDTASGNTIKINGNSLTATAGTATITVPNATGTLAMIGADINASNQVTVTHLASPLPLTQGGTAASLVASNGGIFYSTGSAGAILAGTATANQIVLSGASAAPTWSTATYPATTTANQLLYSSATNTIAGLATAANGVLVTSSGSVPSIGTTLPAAVQANITQTGTITSGAWTGALVGLAYGGTNANLTPSTGGIVYSGVSSLAILLGTATARLPVISGASSAPTWWTVSLPASVNSGGIPYYSSTSAESSSATLTAHGVLLGEGAGNSPVATAAGTTGQVLGATTGSDPAFTTISAILDSISSTQGTVLYRSATGWTGLGPGTSGQFLQTLGAASNPQWASVSGVISGLATNAIVTAASATSVQTINSSATMDSSGNIVTPGTITVGSGSGVAGYYSFTQGSAAGTYPANSATIQAPAAIATSYQWTLPGADAAGAITSNGSGTLSVIAINGSSGSLQRTAGNLSITTGKSVTFQNSMTILSAGDSAVITVPNVTGTLLTTASPVTAPQGGTGIGVGGPTAHAVMVGEGNSAMVAVGPGTTDQFLQGNGSTNDPVFGNLPACASDGAHAWTYSTSTHTIACTAITAGSVTLNTIGAAVGANTIANGDNAQVWQWSLTTASKSGFTFGENSASTATGTPYLVNIQTLAASTANPLIVTALGTANGVQVDTTGKLSKVGTGSVTADALSGVATSALSDQLNIAMLNRSNTFGAFTQDFTSSTGWKPPTSIGATATSTKMLAYDSGSSNWHIYDGADAILAPFASAPTNGHCIQATVASGKVTLSDSGNACGTGTGGGSNVGFTPTVASITSGSTTSAAITFNATVTDTSQAIPSCVDSSGVGQLPGSWTNTTTGMTVYFSPSAAFTGTCTAVLISSQFAYVGVFSGLPTPSSGHPLALVTDASASGGCSAGSGTSYAVCAWTGSAWVSTASSGSGTVNSGTSGQMAYYASSTSAVSGNANFTVSGSDFTMGVAGSAVGTLSFGNATSGTIKLSPATGALGTSVITIPAATSTMVVAGTSTTTTQVLHATATAGVGAYSALATADMPTAIDTRTAAFTDMAPVSGDSGLVLVLNPATAVHLTRVFCAVQGSTNVVLNLDKRAEGTIGTDSGAHLLGSDLTAVSGGANTSTFANGSSQCGGTSSCAIAAHTPVVATFTSVSGTPTALNCSVDYTVD